MNGLNLPKSRGKNKSDKFRNSRDKMFQWQINWFWYFEKSNLNFCYFYNSVSNLFSNNETNHSLYDIKDYNYPVFNQIQKHVCFGSHSLAPFLSTIHSKFNNVHD